MLKAIQLRVMLWIEGEDEPAHDFAQSTIQAVREILTHGSRAHPELDVSVKEIREDRDWNISLTDEDEV
jgi:hypothetical protein